MKGEASMRSPHLPFAAAIAAVCFGLAFAALCPGPANAAAAQTAVPPSPVAPGAGTPPFGLGGIGPGNVPVAPGAATTGENDLIGPGGRIAPGPAAPLVSRPALPRAR